MPPPSPTPPPRPPRPGTFAASPSSSSSTSAAESSSSSGMSSISTHIDDLGKRISSIRPNPAPALAPSDKSPRLTLPTLPGLSSDKSSPASARRKDGLNLLGLTITSIHKQTSDLTEAKYQEVLQNSGLFHLNEERKCITHEEITQDCILGSGSCGQVFKMQHLPSRTTMAVKIMSRTTSEEDNKRIIMDLDVIVKSYNFPYIVRCLGYFIRMSEVWICMELMATCFDKLLKLIKQPILESILGKLTYSTVTALRYLKDTHGIIHRDVKPSNILLDEQGNIKLCDFGISGILIESMAKSRNAGCAAYMSPERIVPSDPIRPDYDIRADIWSLGISLIELATNAYPYSNCKSEFDVMSRIVAEIAPQLPDHMSFSDDFRSFVNVCLIKDHKERPKYGPLMLYPFFIRAQEETVDVAAWYRNVTLATASPRADETR